MATAVELLEAVSVMVAPVMPNESAAMREQWVSWFGIPTQFAPHWDGDPDTTVLLDVPGGVPSE